MRYLPAHLALAGLSVTAAGAQPLYHLDEPPADAPVAVASAAAAGPAIGSKAAGAHPVRLDLDLLREGPGVLGFPLPDGETFWAVRDRFEEREDGTIVWAGGAVPGYNSVLLMLSDGGLLGTVHADGVEHVIHGDSSSATLESGQPVDEPGGGANDTAQDEGAALCAAGVSTGSAVVDDPDSGEPSNCDMRIPPSAEPGEQMDPPRTRRRRSTSTINVLVVYTADAERDFRSTRWNSSWRSVSKHVNWANEYMNETFSNSEIPAQTVIVGIEKLLDRPVKGRTAYQAGYTWGRDTLDTLTDDTALHALRVKYQADIVYAFVFNWSRSVSCGVAWVPIRDASYEEQMATSFAFTNLRCDYYNRRVRGAHRYWHTTAHEIGHTLGAAHNKSNSGLKADELLYPYAFGYQGNGVISIMAYGSNRLSHFSTVARKPGGKVLGIANEAENDRAVSNRVAVNADYSKHLARLKPDAPTLRTVVDSFEPGAVMIYWTDNADNETHFEVRYRRAGQQWENADWNAAHDRKKDQNKAFIDGLERGKRYTFRVVAVNGYGSSASEKVYHRPR